ncbi:DNA topoisomerase IV, alpha subunit [Nadsonia fulvescens var. elongata DSM 6958]|uniref:DNA topoisomerase (ATP-hydrolyzing) n=1 Tax=Nadsonia fulvescens var. elongata DSM 6958 TaxID=857566 RepID=A0A1E3PKV6_9ASCO|nr:DNA topoisomerase IV, alpha subunit [Nadsonia fulvescens var. elongata DSM 6958]
MTEINKLLNESNSQSNSSETEVDNFKLNKPSHQIILSRIGRILGDLSTSIGCHPMDQELALVIKIAGNGRKLGQDFDSQFDAELDVAADLETGNITVSANKTKTSNNFKRIVFPAKKPEDTWRFCVYLRLLTIIEFNLHYGKVVTTRDLYYQDVSLFRSQQQLKTFIKNITTTLGCESHHDLNIFPSQKGLVWGTFTVYHKHPIIGNDDYSRGNDGKGITDVGGCFIQEFKGAENIEPALIPYTESIRYIQLPTSMAGVGSTITCVLVVEKESIFRTLIKAISALPVAISSNIILVTGRGYPDFVTRAFLSIFNQFHPHIPILGLVDSDPYGIHIHCVYKYGSVRAYRQYQQDQKQKQNNNKPSQSKEVCYNHRRYMVPSIQFMGVSILDYHHGWVHLTPGDRRKAINMLLNSPWLQDKYQYNKYNVTCIDSENLKLRSELQRGLFLGLKAEMNIVKSVDAQSGDDIGKYVSDMLLRKLSRKQTSKQV